MHISKLGHLIINSSIVITIIAINYLKLIYRQKADANR